MRNPSASSLSSRAAGGGSSSNNKTTPCCSKVGLKRGPWTPEEDQLLAKYIEKEGEGRWRTLPKRAGLLRCGKSCRLRWMNYLRPNVKRGHIAPDEEDLILRLHRLLGNRWSLIAGRIPGRTDNEIKNYWNTHLSKKLIGQGIDPRTHKPLNLSPNPNPNPPPNPITNNTSEDQSSLPSNPYLPPAPQSHQLDPHHQSSSPPIALVNCGGYGDLTVTPAATDSDSAIPFASNDNNYTSVLPNEEADDDINYCSDDVFSSFLNSLINYDDFSAQQQQQQQQPPNGINGLGVTWESALISSSSSLSHKDHKPMLDHHHVQQQPPNGINGVDVARESAHVSSSSSFSHNDHKPMLDHHHVP